MIAWSTLYRTFALGVVTMLLLAGSAPGRVVAQSRSQSISAKQSYAQIVRSYLSGLTAAHKFSGRVLVASRGKIIANLSFGYEDYATRTHVGPASEFRLASVTKEFTAFAIFQLQQKGLLSFNNSMCQYVTGCPATGQWQQVKIFRLLDHTSGLPRDCGRFPEPPNPSDPLFEEIEKCIHANTFLFRPGTSYSYSNTDYSILGYIIEKVAGVPYARYMHAHIWNPLHMASTGIGSGGVFYSVPHAALPYATWNVPEARDNTNENASAGGMYSTAADMYAWDRALDMHLLLSAAEYTLYFAGDPITSCCVGGHATYGNGWIHQTQGGRTLIWHNGGLPGVTTYNGRYPRYCVDVIVLSNLQVANATAVGKKIGSEVPFTAGPTCGT